MRYRHHVSTFIPARASHPYNPSSSSLSALPVIAHPSDQVPASALFPYLVDPTDFSSRRACYTVCPRECAIARFVFAAIVEQCGRSQPI